MSKAKVPVPIPLTSVRFRPHERWSDHPDPTRTDPCRGEAVIRTISGGWVLEHWSRFEGERTHFEYISADHAHDWLTQRGEAEAVERYFGPPGRDSNPQPTA